MKLNHSGGWHYDVRVIEIEEDKSLQAGTGLDVQLSMEGVEDAPVILSQNESSSVDNTMAPVVDAVVEFSDCLSEKAGVRASGTREEEPRRPPLLCR